MRSPRFKAGSEAYQRDVSPQEWAHLGNPADGARTIQLFVEGAGRIDPAALSESLAIAGDALPGTRLTRHGRRWVDSGRPPRPRTLDGALLDRTSLSLPGLYRSLRGDFGGPHNEVVLLTGARPTVVFRSHHGVMDGRGLVTWARAVFGALRGEPVEPVLGTDHELAIARRAGVPDGPPPERPQVRAVLRSTRPYARRGKILRRRTLVGNHPAIIAKLAAAIIETLRLPEASFMVTVDLRRHDPALRSTGNLVGAVNVRLEAGDGWQQAQAQLFELLGTHQELAWLAAEGSERVLKVPLPLLRPALRAKDALVTRQTETDFTALVSHWGRLAPADFTTAGFRPHTVFAVPQPGYFLPPGFTLLELPGRTEIVFSCDGGAGAAERAQWLLDRVVATLSDSRIDEDGSRGRPAPRIGSPLELIQAHADRDPHAAALLEPGGLHLDYGQLAENVARVGKALGDLGIRPRDRVAAILPDGLDAAVAFLAVATAAVFCPLNPAYSMDEVDNAFDDLSPALLVAGPGLSTAAREVAQRRGIPVAELERGDEGFRLVPHSGVAGESAPLPDAGESLLLQTSGTSGRTKLVPLTWATMLVGARASCQAYRLEPADRRLNVMSLFHVQGLVGSVLASLASGSSVVCANSAAPEDVLAWLREHDITWFSASPMMHERILEAAATDWRPPPRLRFVRSGSAALPPALRERLEAVYRVPVVESYGMTEAHQIASSPLEPGDAAMVPTGSEVRIRVDGEITAQAGARGEIVVRGANVVSRYLSPAHANGDSFVDGWFRTGDEGELTVDGRLRITGRIKDLIIRGGEKVSPLEVENVLARHPAVRQVVVCGVPDPSVTEQVAAVVVVRDGFSVPETELRQFARASLAPYKVPTIIEYRTALATTKGNKISRSSLARELSASSGRAMPERARATPSDGPRTPTETELLDVWGGTLGHCPDSVHDDFFALGGQSLDGIALLRRVRKAFDVSLDPLALFDQANTIARMARLIDQRREQDRPGPR